MFGRLFSGRRARWGSKIETARIGVRGMTSKRCERTVKKALLTKNGVREVYMNRTNGVATVLFDPAQTDVPQLTEVILRKGYVPGPVVEEDGETKSAA